MSQVNERHTLARGLHDLGLAAWFGGALMGAVGLNGAAAVVDSPGQRTRVANAGWAKWTPVNAVAIGAHLVGASRLLVTDSERVRRQQGVAGMAAVKTALTVAALGATAYSRMLGGKVMAAGDTPSAGGTSPLPSTDPAAASAQRQLAALQWAVPALTGALVVVSALAGEQQRPGEVARGLLRAS